MSDPRYKVDPETGCWTWTHVTHPTGYARLWDGKRQHLAHRFFYEKFVGPIPDGMHIDHLCRNRACVNPDHLEAVTQTENTRRGSQTKLSLSEVRQIRATDRSVSHSELARQFGIHNSVVCRIRNGKAWRELHGVEGD
jgi:hypothetical protein